MDVNDNNLFNYQQYQPSQTIAHELDSEYLMGPPPPANGSG